MQFATANSIFSFHGLFVFADIPTTTRTLEVLIHVHYTRPMVFSLRSLLQALQESLTLYL